MSNGDLHWIATYIWGIADDVLRDLYVRGKYPADDGAAPAGRGLVPPPAGGPRPARRRRSGRAPPSSGLAIPQREIPVRHDLDEWIAAYLEAGGIDLSSKAAPLFLAAERWGLGLTDRPITAHGVRQMLKRRLHEAGLPEIITPHSFRVMVV